MATREDARLTATLPAIVDAAMTRARRAGFTRSCDPPVGELLAVLAAGVASGGRILELGTGVGVGLAWIVHGLGRRGDVEVVSVESDPATAAIAAAGGWPRFVRLFVDDALTVLADSGQFDLVFADAPAGKWEGLDRTIKTVRPGGHLVVDDMRPRQVDEQHQVKIMEVRRQLLEHQDLVSVEMVWASGVILGTRTRRSQSAGA